MAPASASTTTLSTSPHRVTTGERRCLSLRVLVRLIRESDAAGAPLSQEALSLAGINYVEGYVSDSTTHDVILVGRAVNTRDRPPLHLDDLAVLAASAFESQSGDYPFVSLDPGKEMVRNVSAATSCSVALDDPRQLREFAQRLEMATGDQKCRTNLPLASSTAVQMLEIDYTLKQLSQGRITMTDVRSIPDISLAGSDGMASGSSGGISMSRLWYHIQREPTFRASDDGMVLLDDTYRVVVLTESQRAGSDGSLHDAGCRDANAEQFCAEYSDAEAQHPTLAFSGLEGLYRLHACLLAARFRNEPQASGLRIDTLTRNWRLREPREMRGSMPGLANVVTAVTRTGRTTVYRAAIVCGGVSMEAGVGRKQFDTSSAAAAVASRLRTLVLGSRPNELSLCWPVASSSAWRDQLAEPLQDQDEAANEIRCRPRVAYGGTPTSCVPVETASMGHWTLP